MPEVSVFFHLRPLETPSVAPENRHTVSRLAIPNCYRLVVRYGYNDEIITPNLASVIAEQIRRYLIENQILRRTVSSNLAATIMNENRTNSPDHGTTTGPTENQMVSREGCDSELARLKDAYAHKVLYIIGKEQMKIKEGTNYGRRIFLWVFLWIRDNTRNKIANLRVPTDKVIEVGFLKEI